VAADGWSYGLPESSDLSARSVSAHSRANPGCSSVQGAARSLRRRDPLRLRAKLNKMNSRDESCRNPQNRKSLLDAFRYLDPLFSRRFCPMRISSDLAGSRPRPVCNARNGHLTTISTRHQIPLLSHNPRRSPGCRLLAGVGVFIGPRHSGVMSVCRVGRSQRVARGHLTQQDARVCTRDLRLTLARERLDRPAATTRSRCFYDPEGCPPALQRSSAS
jgi:hypothetical protein